ncbi:PilZ domain-containing protein [Rheinheimera sp. YQF-2]|uniref:PilZ domain-containing protein n=1 Tax=Rheinheimera lutimaris TaxID=2740584 RepID=A0A7Y5AU03_9GAMM|nr:PilZ domain-containing protein [Rheinheimera lutimaris]NRQ44532.1 PilZ domain-containing protein [Rheinheimera lutimaris]
MTAADLQQYIGVIDRMKSLLNSADFDQVFSLLTSDLPKSKQFLLKMELKRMAQPCNYFIDLRGHVDGDVIPYDYMGKTHYMDYNAIKVFEAGLKQYGSYTLGLYEEVLNTENNFRVMHRKETEQRVRTALQQSPDSDNDSAEPDDDALPQYANIVRFGGYTARRDERMHFSIDVEIELGGKRIRASTSDLSVSGSKIKLQQPMSANIGQTVKLHFTGLEQEFILGLADGVMYKIVDIDTQAAAIYWRLQRQQDNNEPQFVEFLQNFINANKRRYKVNLNSVCQSLRTKGYEQFYLPRISSLPVFIAVKDGRPEPVCTLTTDYNKAIWHYFLDEQHQAVFASVCHARRLKSLLQMPGPEQSTILYCFTHAVKGRLFFYSATREELAASEQLKETFLGFGAGKPSWRVFHFSVLRTTPSQAEMPATLPESSSHKKAAPLSARVEQFIQDIRYIVNLTDINGTDTTFWYQSYPVDQQQLKSLAQFGHKKPANPVSCEAVPVQYVNLRSESRYLYKTNVSIRDANATELNGHSRDFSSKGLQVETAIPVRFNKGDVLQLSLPDMQKISNKYALSSLQYEVMAVSKSRTIMNLRAVETDEPHTGRLFFSQLIQNNRAKLTPAEESPKYPGLSTALRNMYLNVHNCFALYLHRKGIRYDIDTIAKGNSSNSLHKLLSLHSGDETQIDLALILQNNAASLNFAQQLKQMKRFDSPKQYELFLLLSKEPGNEALQISCKYDYEFSSEQSKQQFVLDARQHGILFCYRLLLSRTGRPDTDYIAQELSYISAYAIHKARQLEEELWSVAGMIDAVDISAEIYWRYGAVTESEKQQQQRLQLLSTQLQQPVV